MEIFDRIQQQLLNCPVVEISGLVDRLGVCPISYENNNMYILTFDFEKWKIGDGLIKTRPLTIRWREEVAENEKDRICSWIKKGDTLRITARFAEKTELRRPFACPVEILEQGFDEPAFGETINEIIIEHARLGSLVLDREFNAFQCEIKWARKKTGLRMYYENDYNVDNSTTTAMHLLENEAGIDDQLRALLVKDLLPVKNQAWLFEGQNELTPAEFLKKIKLYLIETEGEYYNFWYKDGRLFSGHDILVSGEKNKGPDKAKLAG